MTTPTAPKVTWWRRLLPWRRSRPTAAGPETFSAPRPPAPGPDPSGPGSAAPAAVVRPRGVALVGRIWRGGDHEPRPGVVVVDAAGRIARVEERDAGRDPDLPADLEVITAAWVGPGLIDTHVCPITAASSPVFHAAGVAVVRGVGGADDTARLAAPDVAITDLALGPDLDAAEAVRRLRQDGVTVIRVDLRSRRDLIAAAVAAAHEAGLAVTADAGTAALVGRALDAEVDELLRLPHERLPVALVERLAAAGTGVSSTLQAFFSDGRGRDAAQNAVDLVRAGVPLRYGTCVGRGRLGVDPRELDRLADTGLGRLGALRAATDVASGAAGLPRERAVLTVGRPADLVVLAVDPLVEPLAWHTPRLVLAGGRRITG